MKILLTGANGFLGSHIADSLSEYKNIELLLTKRKNSNLDNCSLFKDKAKWINLEEDNWIEESIKFKPDIIIHSAWIGVTAKERNDKQEQEKNIPLANQLLEIASKSNIKKFIGLGSQAEYGILDSIVSEEEEANPACEYGKNKIKVLDLIKESAKRNGFDWAWIRIFSIRGERESLSWLLPSVENALNNKEINSMDFTEGLQKYAYLDVKVFAEYISRIVLKKKSESGIYNISGKGARAIRDIITDIRDRLRPDFILNFGAIPTRAIQSTLIEGDMTKFNNEFMGSLELAKRIRIHAIEMTNRGNSSHIASVLSIADILAVLYNDAVNIDPNNPNDPLRDRVILSKGHAGAGIYAVLAEKGFIPKEELLTHSQNGSRLSAHVSHKNVPGVELSTGSLGHGLSVGVGMALAAKLDNKPYMVYVIVGDGECDEGSVWEAIMFANHFKLDNLCLIVDHNKMQSLTWCEDTIAIDPLAQKISAFGWDVFDIDGHNHRELHESICLERNNKPKCVIANTIKGKGVSFMENNIVWHYRSPQGEDYTNALNELRNER
ncbi:MAG: transketolase, beta subunit [Bacteroidetes bacterium]|nr:transketolase, beta subunit [Bacteroidota bacterium]